MIIASVNIMDNNLLIEVKGHSGYDELGKDIVCSSVSTAMYMTVNLLEKMKENISFNADDKIPKMILNVNKTNSSQIVFENLLETLRGIEQQYPQYLKIKEVRR